MSRPLAGVLLAVPAAILAAAAPLHHTIEPYRSDPGAARALETRASESCASGPDGPRTLPAELFVTDGCSLWLDGDWGEPCCVEHDERYWCGGKASERAAADAELWRCVEEHSNAFVAWLMWVGVCSGGHPMFPTWYRWGYGRGYRPWYGDYPVPASPGTEAQDPSPEE